MAQSQSTRTAVTGSPVHQAGLGLARWSCPSLLVAPLLLFLTGCLGNPLRLFNGTDSGSDALVLRDGKLQPDGGAGPGSRALEEALELFRKEDYAGAERQFATLADNKKYGRRVAEEARYYQAECQRLQGHYRRAGPTYHALVKEHPGGAHHQLAIQRMFEIANYWLDDTRTEMENKIANKNATFQVGLPRLPLHFSRDKPLLDTEGHAIELLEACYLHDPVGPLAERCLFYLGSVKFFREDYKNADYYFGQLVKNYPNSALTAKALELSIICKQLSTGGPEYDGRKVAEAREMVHLAMHAYPELAGQKEEFLKRQIYTINDQQARKDMLIAEFYERTGHPGSAYFYYEIVRRRYQGTQYAKEAAERMERLKERAEKRAGWSWWPFASRPTEQPEGEKAANNSTGGGWWPWRRQPADNQPGQPQPGGPLDPGPGPRQYIPGQPLMSPSPRLPEQAPPPRPVP